MNARAVATLVMLAGLAAWAGAAGRQEDFPHAEHQRLFPLCTGCHEGVPTGDRADFYPEPAQCAGCHDGQEFARVAWTGPDREPDNVRFEHPGHAAEVARQGEELDCVECHVDPGAPRMQVEPAVAERCLACHEHEAESHYVDAQCGRCHIPLATTAFDVERVLALPLPDDHDGGFVLDRHGDLAAAEPARCATCHTRERCTACHVDAAGVTEIAAMPDAEPPLELPSFPAHYPIPASHERLDWLSTHGTAATRQSCTTCHTRDDCTACHVAPAPAPVGALPARADVQAPGARLVRRAPPSHASPMFERAHGTDAAADRGACESCHQRNYCEDCHRGEDERETTTAEPARVAAVPEGGASFHPADFMLRHGAPAWNRRLECSNCHDTRRFCRDCHEGLGMQTFGRLGQGFHDAEPLWLLRHPQAARQGLESCTSCHTQQDCMQCHSTVGSFQVNPHGRDFDARRAQKRNAAICLACHLGNPLNRRSQ